MDLKNNQHQQQTQQAHQNHGNIQRPSESQQGQQQQPVLNQPPQNKNQHVNAEVPSIQKV